MRQDCYDGPVSNTRARHFCDDATWSLDFGDGLVFRGTEDPRSPILTHFFAGYDRAFTLPDEREELDGFRACLSLNPQSRRRFGRVQRELVMVADDAVSGALLGGANFMSVEMPLHRDHPRVTVALNYIFVERAARGRGLSRRLLEAIARLANRAVDRSDESIRPAMFIEQNDPLRMTAEEYAADTSHADIDQIDRLAIWARLGARLVDFPYVQPALSAGQESDHGLAYAVIRFPRDSIDAAYLHDHLESYFGISVLKGGDPATDPTAGPQLSMLRAMARNDDAVPLVPMDGALVRLRASSEWPRGLALRNIASPS